MKRRKVMRLLAVAMAASLAVTSQGIPSGLTVVYADQSGFAGAALSEGHLYQEVTPGGHTHNASCYGGEGKYYTVQASDTDLIGKYYIKYDTTAHGNLNCSASSPDCVQVGDNYYHLVKAGDVLVASATGAASASDVTKDTPEDVKSSYSIGTSNLIFHTVDSDGTVGTGYTVYAATAYNSSEADSYKVETAYVTQNNNVAVGSKVAYLTSSDSTTIKGLTWDTASTVDASTANSLAKSDDTTLNTSGWFTVTKYGLAAQDSTDAAKEIPGAIEVKEDSIDYTNDNYGFVTDGDESSAHVKAGVYVPLLVTSGGTTPTFTGGEIIKNGDTIYGYYSSAWYTLVKSTEVPDTFTVGDGTITIPLVSLATTSCTTENDSYSYYELEVSGEGAIVNKTTATTISDESQIYKVDGKYYVDVCKDFVTGIELATPSTTERLVTSDQAENTVDDAIVLVKGNSGDTSSTEDKTTKVDKVSVSSNYASVTTSGTVTIQNIASNELYVKKTSGSGTIVKTGDGGNVDLVKNISSFDKTSMTTLGLASEAIAYTKTIITAPTITSVEVTAGEEYKIADAAVTDTTYGKIYDASSNGITVTATVGTAETYSGYIWKYTWKDLTGDTYTTAAGEAANTGDAAAAADNTVTYTIANTSIGAHKVVLVAELWANSGDPVAAAYTKVYTDQAVSLSAVVTDSTAVSNGISNLSGLTYGVAPSGTPAVTPTSANEGVVSDIKYYVKNNASDEGTTTFPQDAGNYTAKATIAADYLNGYALTEISTDFTIGQASAEASGSDYVKGYTAVTEGVAADVNNRKVDLSTLLTGAAATEVKSASDAQVTTAFAGSNTGSSIFASFSLSNGVLTYVLSSNAVTGDGAASNTKETINGTITTDNYVITVSYEVEIAAGDVEEIEVIAENARKTTYYYGDKGENYDPKADLISNAKTDGTYTFTYTAQTPGAEGAKTFPQAAGTYDVTIEYKSTDTKTTGKETTTLTIAKKPVTVTILTGGKAAETMEADGSVPAVTVSAVDSENKALTITSLDDQKVIYKNSQDEKVTGFDGKTLGKYTLDLDTTDFEANYEIDVVKATLTVQKVLNLAATDVESTAGAAPVYKYTVNSKSDSAAEGELPEGAEVTYTIKNSAGDVVTGNPTVPGDYTITPAIDFTKCDAGTADLYKVVVSGTDGKLTVKKAEITIHIQDASYYIGQTGNPVYSYKAMNGVDEVTLTNPTVVYKVTNGTTDDEIDLTTAKENETFTITATVTLTSEADKTAYEIKTVQTGTLTVKAARTKVTVSASGGSVTVDGNFTPVITVKDSNNETLGDVATDYIIYKQGDSTKTDIGLTAALAKAGTYIIEPSLTNKDDVDKYEATIQTGTLTVSAASTYTPPASTDKDTSGTTETTEPTLTTNADGDKVIVDADGKVIADELVTIDGKSYVTDEDGVILTSQIAEVGDVKVYVGKNGVVATDKAVTYEGKKYYATENGEIATNGFVTTARGNKVYATKSGALKTSTAFTVKGKKYYAKASGVIATTGFVKTAKGNTVYATKSGVLKVNTAFKASNGKKYVADKNGKIVKGKKITIGKKTYTTNKKGVIVKVTTKKK